MTKIGDLIDGGFTDRQAQAVIRGVPPLELVFHSDAGADFVMTNATQAERNAGGSARHIRLVDLSGYSRVRLQANIVTDSASVNTPKLLLSYSTTFGGTYAPLAEVSVFTGTAGTVQDSGWQTLPVAARANVYLALREIGGDGVADPAVGVVVALFDALAL